MANFSNWDFLQTNTLLLRPFASDVTTKELFCSTTSALLVRKEHEHWYSSAVFGAAYWLKENSKDITNQLLFLFFQAGCLPLLTNYITDGFA